jgi:hypothetical protein
MAKKVIRLTEGDLHRIIKESVEQIIENAENEGLFGTRLFGNDEKYGEKWYNPFSWASKKDKERQDAFAAKMKKWKANRAQRKEWDREERNATERRNKETDKLRNKGVNLCEPDYRPRNADGTLRVDFAGHVRPYRQDDAAYDAGLR